MPQPEPAIVILGAGAFGTALGVVQAAAGRRVWLIDRDPARAAAAEARRQSAFLPAITLPDGLALTSSHAALATAGILLVALPAQASRAALAALAGRIDPEAILVLCAKGVERETLALQTEIAGAELPGHRLAVLTGPGFAAEIAAGLPTALTLATGLGEAPARALQAALSTPALRLYLTDDMIGAQLGGAMKNVVAIACGIATGAGLGESARAALLTRGMAEMVRLAGAMGARADTLAGLSGLGDLALTAASAKSRNFALGQAIGAGRAHPQALSEGSATAGALEALGRRHRLELPITATVSEIVAGRLGVAEAVARLLARPLRAE